MAGNFQAEFTLIKVIVTLTFQLNIRKKNMIFAILRLPGGKASQIWNLYLYKKILDNVLGHQSLIDVSHLRHVKGLIKFFVVFSGNAAEIV